MVLWMEIYKNACDEGWGKRDEPHGHILKPKKGVYRLVLFPESRSIQNQCSEFFVNLKMCLLLHYAYTCSPMHTELLMRPCHLYLSPCSSNSPSQSAHRNIYRIRSVPTNNPFLRTCPCLWEKRICPPMCVECTTRIIVPRKGVAARVECEPLA
jgi:hypothetical protein